VLNQSQKLLSPSGVFHNGVLIENLNATSFLCLDPSVR